MGSYRVLRCLHRKQFGSQKNVENRTRKLISKYYVPGSGNDRENGAKLKVRDAEAADWIGAVEKKPAIELRVYHAANNEMKTVKFHDISKGQCAALRNKMRIFEGAVL